MDTATTPIVSGTDSPLGTRRKIVRAALAIGARTGNWDAVRVHDVAREADISMEEMSRHFGDKDAIADACFDEADAALVRAAEQAGWSALPPGERLFRTTMAWLDALAPQRRLVGGMLRYKLHPEHLHLQARGVARISRTVQWIREVSLLPATGWRRELEEAALTSIYLATFACWLTDDTVGSARTQRMLRRLLANAERAASLLTVAGASHPVR
jgi:ubiquinone biosynthesis protein COQ9